MGEQSLSRARFLLAEYFNLVFYPNHQFYLGADYGRVSWRKCTICIGHAADGCSGRLQRGHKVGGMFAYDLFVYKLLHKPKGFQTTNTVYGFNLNYSF